MAFSDKAPDPSITPNTYDAALAIIDASERDILSAPDFQTLNALSVDAEIALGIIEASGKADASVIDDLFKMMCDQVIARTVDLAETDPHIKHELTRHIEDRHLLGGVITNKLLSVVRITLDKRAGKNIAAHKDAVMTACYNKSKVMTYSDEVLNARILLAEGFSPVPRDHVSDHSALHLVSATHTEHVSFPRLVRLLLSAGIKADVKTKAGETPLTKITMKKAISPRSMQSALLLMKAGADPYHQSEDGRTPYDLLLGIKETNPTPEAIALCSYIKEHYPN